MRANPIQDLISLAASAAAIRLMPRQWRGYAWASLFVLSGATSIKPVYDNAVAGRPLDSAYHVGWVTIGAVALDWLNVHLRRHKAAAR